VSFAPLLKRAAGPAARHSALGPCLKPAAAPRAQARRSVKASGTKPAKHSTDQAARALDVKRSTDPSGVAEHRALPVRQEAMSHGSSVSPRRSRRNGRTSDRFDRTSVCGGASRSCPRGWAGALPTCGTW